MSDEDRPKRTDEQAALNIDEILIRLLENMTHDTDGRFWRALYALQSRRLSETAVRMGLPRPRIDNLIQDVWVKILPQWDSLRRAEGARRFLVLTAKMMHDAAVDAMRKSDRRQTESLDSLQTEPPDDNASDPADSMTVQERREGVAAALTALEKAHPKYTWVLRENFLKERSLKELAKERKTTTHALSCLKSRAVQELRRLLLRRETDGETPP